VPAGTPHQAEALEDTFELDMISPVRNDWISEPERES
jgi:quercetin dioxygenase-like cupin family protein